MWRNTSAPDVAERRPRWPGATVHPVADAADLDEHLAGRATGRAACPAASRSRPLTALRRRPTRGRGGGAWARWQRARARGVGGVGRPGRHGRGPSRACTMRPPAPCGAAPAGDRLLDLVGRVLRRPRRPAATASASARPLAWPTAMAVRTLAWKNTRSTATASGWSSAISARSSRWSSARRCGQRVRRRACVSTPTATGRGAARAGGVDAAVAAARQARVDAQDEHASRSVRPRRTCVRRLTEHVQIRRGCPGGSGTAARGADERPDRCHPRSPPDARPCRPERHGLAARRPPGLRRQPGAAPTWTCWCPRAASPCCSAPTAPARPPPSA